jgi:two-component sensor histidine kinase
VNCLAQGKDEGMGEQHSDLTLPTDACAARLARRHFTTEHGDDPALAGDVFHNALLVLSELVANAIAHGAGNVHLTVDVNHTRIRLEVHDESPDLPQQRSPALDRDHGRGLLIVDTLADAWGTRDTPLGKAVWCDISLT